MWRQNTITKSGNCPSATKRSLQMQGILPVLTGAKKEEDWHQAEWCPSWQTPLPLGNFQMWQLLPRAMLSSAWCHRHTKKLFSMFAHSFTIHWRNGWSRSYIFLPWMLEQICKLVDSHLRSKEANIRLSQLSGAWFRRKCKQLYNSNIRVPPSIYKGGNRRNDSVHTENAESGNIKNINEKLWKPVPYWMCCPGLLLVQRVGNNLVLGWHIQVGSVAATLCHC